ncbi:MAG: glycosyltransferase family 4 protein, partial [Ornithinimicrobium sp.]
MTKLRTSLSRLRRGWGRKGARQTEATPDPTSRQDDPTGRLKALTAAREHEAAMQWAEEHWHTHSEDRSFLKQVRTSASAAGAISVQRRALALEQQQWPGAAVSSSAAATEGRWRETSADWAPHLASTDGEVPEGTETTTGRILHVLKISMPHRQSGYTMRTMYSLTGQRRAGLDPVGVTALDFPASVGIDDAAPQDEVDGIRYRRLLREAIPAKQPLDTYLDDWADALLGTVKEEKPEILHAHSGHRGYDSALVTLAVGKHCRLPVVYEVRGFFESLWTSDTAWAEQSEVYRRRHDTEARCMNEADAVVTLSESMRADIVARGVPCERVHVVPNGVDTARFVPRERPADLVERWGLGSAFVFGYVSNLDHYREGQELLIDAAVELRDRGVDAVALIVGDGSRREALEEHARERGAGASVVFTGKVPHHEVLDYYALYDTFVVPRVDERAARLVTPLKPYEAMAMGIPLVVSDLPALAEITGHGQRGATFATGNAQSLTEVLAGLINDPTRREGLA